MISGRCLPPSNWFSEPLGCNSIRADITRTMSVCERCIDTIGPTMSHPVQQGVRWLPRLSPSAQAFVHRVTASVDPCVCPPVVPAAELGKQFHNAINLNIDIEIVVVVVSAYRDWEDLDFCIGPAFLIALRFMSPIIAGRRISLTLTHSFLSRGLVLRD